MIVEGQDELQISAEQFSFDQQLFISSLVYTYLNLFEDFQENLVSDKNYSPPLVERDIQVLYEVYLI